MPDLRGCCDLHVHCGPEPIPRKFDVLGLDRVFADAGMEGVAKSHFYSTVPFAALAESHSSGTIWGSLTLNHYVGGLNPDAVRGSLGVCRNGIPLLRIVWMPTLHAASHLDVQRRKGNRHDIPAEWTGGAVSPGSRPISDIEPICVTEKKAYGPLLEILDLLAENDVALATGHLSAEEVRFLVPLARSRGVRHVILTHPFYETTELANAELSVLTEFDGVYAEQSWALTQVDGIPIERIAESICALGDDRVLLTTDAGLARLPSPPEAMHAYAQALQNCGVPAESFRKMASLTPRKILGIA